MTDAPAQNTVASSAQPLVRINGESLTPEAQQALQEIDRLVASSVVDDSLAEAIQVLAQLAPIRLQPNVKPITLPIFGGILTRLKRALHQLILFYLGDIAAQQSAFNYQLLKVLQRMANLSEQR